MDRPAACMVRCRYDRVMTAKIGFVALLASCSLACGEDPAAAICSGEALTEALAGARAGDTVELGACEVGGSFVVPAGVTLRGAGRGESRLRVAAEAVGLELVPGGSPAIVRDLSIESDGRAAVVAIGDGEVVIENVDVTATRGIALGAQDLSSLALTSVTLEGPLQDAAAAGALPIDVTGAETATHGLVLVRVAQATLDDVRSSGFAYYGAMLVEGATTWTGGGAGRNLGTGLYCSGGSAELVALELSEIWQGFRLAPARGAIFAQGASIVTRDLEALDGEGIGLFQDSATARHEGLVARGNGLAATWIQRSESFELSDGELADNGLAGVIASQSSGVIVRDTRIDGTTTVVRITGLTGGEGVADGVQLVDTTEDVVLEDLSLSGNERVGILLDASAGSLAGVTLAGITVDGSGDSLGAIAQAPDVPEGWDAGVTRQGATLANDEGLQGSLAVVGIIEPNDLPEPDDLTTLIGR